MPSPAASVATQIWPFARKTSWARFRSRGFMPPWISSRYDVQADALVLTFHRSSASEDVAASLEPLQQDQYVTRVLVENDHDANLVKVIVGLQNASSYWVTVQGADAIGNKVGADRPQLAASQASVR